MSIYQDNLLQRKRWQIFSLIMALIVILCLIIIAILALTKEETIRYVEFSTDDNFKFRVLESDEIKTNQKDLIILSQLKEYIKSRVENLGGQKYNKNEIDDARFNYVKAFSNQEVFSQYFEELQRIHASAQFSKRDVKIVSAIKQEQNKYLFSFNTIDDYEEEEIINRFNVYLKFEYQDINKLPPALKKLNPLGVKITWYRDYQETNNINLNSNHNVQY